MNKILTIIALLFFVGLAQAANVDVKWTPPTVCTDGSAAATNCPTTGWEIYMGTSLTGTFTKVNVAPPASATIYSLSGVTAGQKCFFMKTVSNALISAESNRICVDIPVASPTAPVITVTITVSVSTAPPTP